MADVRDFRKLDRPALLAQLHEMTRRRFLAARHLATRQAWDFFMLVEMGPDRIHHCFWRFMDPRHPAYTPGHPFEFAIRDYYEALDREVGALLAAIPDDVAVLVVSDHGARAMQGGFALNQWLLEQGYLVLKAPPASPGPLQIDQIDFSRTKAWGDGGYYGRVFLNVQGREPEGIVPQTEAETLRATLKEALENTTDENGRHLGTQVLLPEQLYREVKGVPPDLLVYFGALDWRAVGSVGLPSIWTRENDTGPDDANHDPLGIFIWKDPRNPGKGEHRDGLSLLDITPGLLKYYGLEVPAELPGSGW
jgi:predicted AlkP superfamily phosphohydrolase/phosphomutase